MTTVVDKSIEVDVPVSTAYNQWTQFEEFPRFMGGVQEVRQLDDRRMHWVARIAGVRREWDATVLEQVPDEKVAWAATEGATNAGAVYFQPVGTGRTRVRLHLEYEPEGLVEKAGDKLDIVEKQAESDLEKFKSFIESRGVETGAWRGSIGEGLGVGTPGVAHAAASQGDSGRAGASGLADVKHRSSDDDRVADATERDYVVTEIDRPAPDTTTYPGGPVSEPNRPL
ncbi:SRPBCC family protein [Micromonospora sp. KC723]|nr:SRPBCC family protein [Micromonospora sp. KC723]